MPYKVYAALTGDINSGWVWIGDFEGKQRSVVKITNKDDSRRSVYCEALKIDDNFITQYEQGNTIKIENKKNSIVANEWYRAKLGVNKNTDARLLISPQNHLIGNFMACIHHPQIVVRLATWLGLISLALGIVGVFL